MIFLQFIGATNNTTNTMHSSLVFGSTSPRRNSITRKCWYERETSGQGDFSECTLHGLRVPRNHLFVISMDTRAYRAACKLSSISLSSGGTPTSSHNWISRRAFLQDRENRVRPTRPEQDSAGDFEFGTAWLILKYDIHKETQQPNPQIHSWFHSRYRAVNPNLVFSTCTFSMYTCGSNKNSQLWETWLNTGASARQIRLKGTFRMQAIFFLPNPS